LSVEESTDLGAGNYTAAHTLITSTWRGWSARTPEFRFSSAKSRMAGWRPANSSSR
jgi:hypothetical protein